MDPPAKVKSKGMGFGQLFKACSGGQLRVPCKWLEALFLVVNYSMHLCRAGTLEPRLVNMIERMTSRRGRATTTTKGAGPSPWSRSSGLNLIETLPS